MQCIPAAALVCTGSVVGGSTEQKQKLNLPQDPLSTLLSCGPPPLPDHIMIKLADDYTNGQDQDSDRQGHVWRAQKVVKCAHPDCMRREFAHSAWGIG